MNYKLINNLKLSRLFLKCELKYNILKKIVTKTARTLWPIHYTGTRHTTLWCIGIPRNDKDTYIMQLFQFLTKFVFESLSLFDFSRSRQHSRSSRVNVSTAI